MVGITDGPLPKHQQMRELIVGLAVPGRSIPSERDLARRYGVSRATVRQAIDGLVSDGALQRILGKGTFAVQPRLASQLHLASFSQDMRQRGLVPSTRVLAVELTVPPAAAVASLGLDEGETAWRVRRVRLADGEPIALEDGYYPSRLFPALGDLDLVSGSLYKIMGEHYGLWVDQAEQTLWGECIDAECAEALSAPTRTPILVFLRHSRAGVLPVEYVVSKYRGDRYQLHMSLSSGGQQSLPKKGKRT